MGQRVRGGLNCSDNCRGNGKLSLDGTGRLEINSILIKRLKPSTSCFLGFVWRRERVWMRERKSDRERERAREEE